jgi:hypothetical protein
MKLCDFTSVDVILLVLSVPLADLIGSSSGASSSYGIAHYN